jgi:hypothetical protein
MLDDLIRVNAFFAEEGIVADEITVLDNRNAQFRLRGPIWAVLTAEGVTTITVMNIDINVDDETDITRRASRLGNKVPAAELDVGDLVNVSGGMKDDSLYAKRIHVGNRLEGDIELEGEIIEVNESSIVVLIDGIVPITVAIDEDTNVSGELEVGSNVEVEGRFDENLVVLGFEIVVDEDGDGDGDDDNNRGRRGDHNPNDDGSKIASRIKMESASDDISASARFKYFEKKTRIKQNVSVEIEDGSVNTDYTIIVVFGSTEVDFGQLTTDEFGNGEVEFETDDDGSDNLTSLIPAGMDVTDITAVKILDGGSTVLEGSF